nr:hypothetical protein [Tanacetum cinerariifolium]
MTDLQFVDQHNMLACLERTDGNAEFHQIVDFLTSSMIHYALTQIHAKVYGRTVVISESSMRNDLHFIDEDGITYQSNDEIIENLALMGYERVSTKLLFKRLSFPINGILAVVSQPQKTHTPRITKRGWDTEIPQSSGPAKKVSDEAVYTEEDDRVGRVATTAASLEAESKSGNINKIQPMATLNEPSPQRTGLKVYTFKSGEDSMEHQDDLTDFVPPTPHDLPFSRGHTPRSDEGRTNIYELMNICTQLSNRVLALKQFKAAQDLVIKRLKKKVKRLEKRQKEITPKMKLFTIVFDNTTAIEKDVNAVEPVSTAGDAFNTASVILDVSAASPSTSTAGDFSKDEMTTMADTLMAIRSTRPRTTLVVIRNVEQEPRRATPLSTVQSQDKSKGKMFEREQRIARVKAAEQEAKDVALIKQMEDVQARMDADALLAE